MTLVSCAHYSVNDPVPWSSIDSPHTKCEPRLDYFSSMLCGGALTSSCGNDLLEYCTSATTTAVLEGHIYDIFRFPPTQEKKVNQLTGGTNLSLFKKNSHFPRRWGTTKVTKEKMTTAGGRQTYVRRPKDHHQWFTEKA
jgi:hypothetical protein